MNQLMSKNIRMTSLDIAEIVGKEHKNVMRDIRIEIEELGDEVDQLIFEPIERLDSRNRKQPCYQFGKDGAMQLALKYDAKTRYKVIKRIEELENQPQLPMNNTKLLLETALKHETKIETIESDVSYLKGNMRVDSLQQQDIQAAAKKAVVQALGGGDSVAYHEMSKKVFSAFWREFKQHFKVPRYGDIPKVKFDEAVRFIELWRPNTSLQIEIDNCNSQMVLT
ncbi:Rha family transcriptional regulator [Pseudogracilibacillus auburnensis]|uniref:Rha family transcriptional regulator n=1 Tax=Pseudogracilibacillus auburnensis TaxID=1494959 RepID=UPI001A978308|nr:Rha family transcriptional regulator [Pseudogracilibacillus auburnensis]MBO1003157.1 ORF6C domain-containing protein [Pseudogracilibacillus auburnensis]